MKRIYIALMTVCCLLASCDKYDDTAVKDAIASLEGRVEALEKLNNEIAALKAVVEGKALVASFVEEDGVCTITLSDGNSFKVQSGLTQHPVVTVMVENERNYWAYYSNGEVKPLLYNGKMVEVTSVAPAIKFNDEGHLEISIDGGRVWVESEGTVAAGLFSEVTQEDNYLLLTLSDGYTQYRVQMLNEDEVHFYAASGRLYFNAKESKIVPFEMIGVDKFTVTEKPDGWKVKLVSGQMTITAPESNNGETEGYIKLLGVGKETVIAQVYVSIGKAPCLVSVATDLTVTFSPNPQSFFYGASTLEEFNPAAIAGKLSGVTNPQMVREYPFSSSVVKVPLTNLIEEVVEGETYVVWALPATGGSCTANDIIYETVSSIGIVSEVSNVTFEDARVSVNVKGTDTYYLIPLENDMTLETCLSDLAGAYAATYDRYKHNGVFRGKLSDIFENLIAGTEYSYLVLPVKLGVLRKDDAKTFNVKLADYMRGGDITVTLAQIASQYKSISVSLKATSGAYKYFIKVVSEEEYNNSGYSDDNTLLAALAGLSAKKYSALAVHTESALESGSSYYVLAVAIDRNGIMGAPARLQLSTKEVLYSNVNINIADVTTTLNSTKVTMSADGEIAKYRYMFLSNDGANFWYYSYNDNDQAAYDALIYGTAEYVDVDAATAQEGLVFNDLIFGVSYIFRVIGYDSEGKVTALAKSDISPTVGKVIQSTSDDWKSLKPVVNATVANNAMSLTISFPSGCTEAVVTKMSSEEYDASLGSVAARLKTDYVIQHSSAFTITGDLNGFKPEDWYIGSDVPYVLVAWQIDGQWYEPLVYDPANGKVLN